jgi:hypothetical protein
MEKTRRSRMAWGLAMTLAAALLVGSGIMLRYGVQVGQTRVHWHPLRGWWGMKKVEVENGDGLPIGKAYCLGWGAVCVYKRANPALKPDRHVLLIVVSDLHLIVE